MGRTGKEAAGTSKGKKRKTGGQESGPSDEVPRVPKPNWRSGPLYDQPAEWQAELFHDQMNALKHRLEAFVCEKEVPERDFGPWGITDKFRALGWEAALKCYDRAGTNLFDREIQQWMATLTCPPYQGNASRMKLIGTVNGTTVEMSFDSLRRIAKFDSKPVSEYMFPSIEDLYTQPDKHPRWHEMLDFLFEPGTSHGKLYRKNLTIEAKVMLTISLHNVMPRRGDKVEVRNWEVPVLYMLLKGRPLVPYRFIVMQNIWLSRNSDQRKIVPHCRLITTLIKMYGAIDEDDRGSYKKYKPFDIRSLGPGWKFSETDRYLLLRSENQQRWRVLRPDAVPLVEGQEDEVMSEQEGSGEEAYATDPYAAYRNQEAGGTSGGAMPEGTQSGFFGGAMPEGTQSGYVGSAFDYAQRSYDQDWAHTGTMGEVVEHQRPSFFSEWQAPAQMLFDHVTYMSASNERALKRNYDRNEQWNRTNAYAFQEEINDRREDDRLRQAREDWMAGRPIVSNPPIEDYSSLPPYDYSSYPPVPPLHRSRWVDPRHDEAGGSGAQPQGGDGGQGSSSSGAYDFGEFSEMMNSVFGPPRPPYY